MGLVNKINKIIVKIIKNYLLILEEEKKKTTFLFIFSTYLLVFLLKFQSGELVGCRIRFCIQQVPTLHTFDGPHYPQNKKYLKKRDDDTFDGPCYPKNKKYLKKRDDDVILTFFQVFLVLGVVGSVKSI